MRKYSVLAFLSLCALSVFWACGDGEFVGASDGDYLAIERYANVSADEIADVMGKCDGDKKCIEETMKNLQIVDAPDTTKKDSAASSSSAADTTKKDSLLSSSATADTTAKDTTATDSTASSASADTSAVSSSAVADSTASSSSVIAGSSSSAAASSSSRGGRGSSDSADDESSSSEADEGESSASEEDLLPVEGTCQSDVSTIGIGGYVTWTYTPNSGSRQSGFAEWNDDFATADTYNPSGEDMFSVVMQYTDVDAKQKVYPTLAIDGVEINCDNAAVTISSLVVSSSSTPGSSASAKSSASVESSSSTVVKSSSSGGGVPVIVIKSSSSKAVSSSSSDPASSSSEEEKPASSESQPASSDDGGEVSTYNVKSDEYSFNIKTPMKVCFADHEVKNTWQTTAHISFGSCGEAGCSLTVGEQTVKEWGGLTLEVPLDENKKFSGCYEVTTSNNVSLDVSIFDY